MRLFMAYCPVNNSWGRILYYYTSTMMIITPLLYYNILLSSVISGGTLWILINWACSYSVRLKLGAYTSSYIFFREDHMVVVIEVALLLVIFDNRWEIEWWRSFHLAATALMLKAMIHMLGLRRSFVVMYIQSRRMKFWCNHNHI